MKILIEKEVLQQALLALEMAGNGFNSVIHAKLSYDALRTTLEAGEKVEPVAWINQKYRFCQFSPPDHELPTYKELLPLYDLRGIKLGADKTGVEESVLRQALDVISGLPDCYAQGVYDALRTALDDAEKAEPDFKIVPLLNDNGEETGYGRKVYDDEKPLPHWKEMMK